MILESSITYLVVGKIIDHIWVLQVTLVIKNLLENATDIRDAYLIPGVGRSPGGGNGNPLSTLTRRISWTEEAGGLQSIGSQRVGHD